MTTRKTAELIGPLLDAAVALAEGFPTFWICPGDESRDESCVLGPARAEDSRFDWNPSADWNQGGPIIERERIVAAFLSEFVAEGAEVTTWCAFVMGQDARPVVDVWPTGTDGKGDTPLIAAMRAYVASKLGETVELP